MPDRQLTVAFIGNFEPEFSTENEYRDAWERAGHLVVPYQEGDVGRLAALVEHLQSTDPPDLVQWTRTGGLAARVGNERLWEMLRIAGRHSVPVVGVHLDIWWGFEREREIPTDPYFRGVDLLMTADGGNQDAWESVNVNHRWLLPAISERWLGVGTPQQKYRSKIAFTGSWQGGYHPEATHRHELVDWLARTYGDDVRFWPKRGQHAIRGRELNDLYASVDVVVGDSAVLPGKSHYCSDRIPETLGRGGLLLHPFVEGIQEVFESFWWEQGDWSRLEHEIERIASFDIADDEHHRRENVDHIAGAHTYSHRVREIVAALEDEEML